MRELTVVIPGRNEEHMARTIADVLAHREADTEVIAVLDSAWADPAIPQHPDVTVIYEPVSIGQRAATNLGVKVSQARYVMKADAHVSFDQGFDRKLIEAAQELGPDVTQIPAQRNLHLYDRVCRVCGFRNYQGPKDQPCEKRIGQAGDDAERCGGACDIEIVWQPRGGTTTAAWCFDSTMHFQYGGYRRQSGDIVDAMTSLGACFFIDREQYWKLGGFDETHGSWGQFGVELACKSWLSGGRHVVNRKTWFAHFFRVGGIGFPYPIKHSDQEKAREYSRSIWLNNAWEGQTKPLSWLVEKFQPIVGWHSPQSKETPEQGKAREAQLIAVKAAGEAFGSRRTDGSSPEVGVVGVGSGADGAPSVRATPGGDIGSVGRDHQAGGERASRKGIVYYTDGKPSPDILDACRKQLEKAGLPIVAVSLKPLEWPAATVIHVGAERGYLTMARQILTALEWSTAETIYFCEHDCLYHPSHFEFTPTDDETFFYNRHVYKVDATSGRALHYLCDQLSGLCANRELLLTHFRKRVERIESEGFSRRMGFEPGTRNSRRGGIDDIQASYWLSLLPNIDIRHGQNLTPSRWRKDQFRDQKYTFGWTEADAVPGWGTTKGRFSEFLEEIGCA